MIADCHIYDRHVPMIRRLLEREPFPAPTVRLDPEVRDFHASTKDSFTVESCRCHEFDEKIPVAV